MNASRRASAIVFLGLAAWLLGGASAARAGVWLGFRNELPVPVVMQGASVVKSTVRRDRPHLLYPGEVAWDSVSSSGDKVLTIYYAKQPTQVLYYDTIPSTGGDQFFAIQLDPPPPVPRGQKPLPPKVKLVPAQAPSPPPNAADKPPAK